jgi:hypothetical protein
MSFAEPSGSATVRHRLKHVNGSVVARLAGVGLLGPAHLLIGLNRTVMKFVGGGDDMGINDPQRGIAIG